MSLQLVENKPLTKRKGSSKEIASKGEAHSNNSIEPQRELEILKEKQESYIKAAVEFVNCKNDMVAENQKLKNKLKSSVEEAHSWQLEYDNAKFENLELQKQLKALRSELGNLEKNNKSKLLSLQKTIQERDTQISKLKSKLQEATKNKQPFLSRLPEKNNLRETAKSEEEEKISLIPATRVSDDENSSPKSESLNQNEVEIKSANQMTSNQGSENIQERQIASNKAGRNEEKPIENDEEAEVDHWKWIAKKKTLKVEILKLNNEQMIDEINSIIDFLDS